VIQKKKGAGPLSAPIANFDGICLPFGDKPCAEGSSCSCLPPDTNGAVGATQFVQIVNSDFAVYSKTGQVLRHATPINQLWSAAGGECAAHNDGDPVAVYDQFATRWLLSEFVATPAAGEDYGECVAISTTSDATGTYNLYFFDWGPNTFLDYPHIGVWPDGYYLSANEFPTGQETSSGAAAIVLERSKMLAGQPARYVWFDEAAANPVGGQYIGQLPGDVDGSKLPPAGAPNVFAEVDDPSSIPPTGTDAGFDLRLWRYHVDWSISGELHLRQQRAAELYGAGRAVRSAAVHLRVRRLSVAEGRPAGARCAGRQADVQARLPQLRRSPVARLEPHCESGHR